MLSILDLKPQPDEKSSAAPKPSPEPPPRIELPPADLRPPIVIESQLPSELIAPANSQPEVKVRLEPAAPAQSPVPVKKSVRTVLRTSEVPVSEPVNIPEEPAVATKAPDTKSESKIEGKDEDGEYELVLGRRQIASWLFVGTFLIAVFSTASYYIGRMSVANPLAELDGKSAPYIAPSSAPYIPSNTAPQVAPPLPVATFVLPGQSANSATKIPANTAVTPAAVSAAVPGSKAATPAPVPQTPTAAMVPPTAPASPAPAPSTPVSAAAEAKNIHDWNEAAGSSHPNDPPIFAAPQTGALYLQMGAVEKGMAVVLAEGLRRHGFSSFVAPGPTDKIFRVLIGPFAKQEDFKKAKAEVDAIDLGTFARRFEK